MHPKVSIIVPCYGVEKYLDRCLESIVNQTLKDLEIILVDDESPDNVPKMCDEWAKKDDRIKVIHKKNAGLGYARNTGMQYASGDYIAFVDSDDYVEITMYETLYNLAYKNDLDILFCGFKNEYAPNKFHYVQECSKYIEFLDNSVKQIIPDFIASAPYEKKEFKYDMSVWHSIYRRSIIAEKHIQFVSERDFVSEDIFFQIDFLTYSKKIAFIPNILCVHCWNDSSLTKKISKEKFKKTKAMYNRLVLKCFDFDKESLRAKRLFLVYISAFIKILVRMKMPFREKLEWINYFYRDDIWNKICLYKEKFLPFRRRVWLFLFRKKYVLPTYLYAMMIEFATTLRIFWEK